MVAQDVQRYLDMMGVFRLTPDGKEVQLVIADCTYPNGLAFSPDEKILYVNDTRSRADPRVRCEYRRERRDRPTSHKLTGTEDGVADGMKCDVEGNVYCTGPGGVHVIAPRRPAAGAAQNPRALHQHGLWRRRLEVALRNDLQTGLPHPG